MTNNSNKDPKDGDALGGGIRLNPEMLAKYSPLPDLDKVEVVVVQQSSRLSRWGEALLLHVVGAFVVTGIAFGLGLVASDTMHAGASKTHPTECPVT